MIDTLIMTITKSNATHELTFLTDALVFVCLFLRIWKVAITALLFYAINEELIHKTPKEHIAKENNVLILVIQALILS